MEWTIEKLTDLSTAYWDGATVAAAVDLGVFDHIGDRETTAENMAGKTGANPDCLARLLDALAALGLLEKAGESYRLDPGAVPLLGRSSPTCILDALRFNIHMYPLWGRLADCVRTGRPPIGPEKHLGGDPSLTRHFVMAMHSRAQAMAPYLIPALHVAGQRMLDLAAGPGTFSRMLAEQNSELQVTQFDLSPVLAIARELGETSPAAVRIDYHDGDYRNDALPGGFDTVLFCGAIHQESPSSASALVDKISRALEPGGELIVVDMMLAPDRIEPKFSALFSLNMMLTSKAGRVFDEAQLSGILAAAGFDKPEVTRLKGCPYWIMRARRP